jgi:hypothetical protein
MDRSIFWDITDVSEEHIAAILRIEKQAEQATSMKKAASRLSRGLLPGLNWLRIESNGDNLFGIYNRKFFHLLNNNYGAR